MDSSHNTKQSEKFNNICAAIVCYRDYAATLQCLESLLNQTHPLKKIYIFDNTEGTESQEQFPELEILEVHRSEENVGIAGAYVWIFRTAAEEGLQWCWTFDQDSVARPNALEEILLNAQHIDDDQIGIIASTGVSRRFGHLYKGLNARWRTPKRPNFLQTVYKCDLVISSGSLTNVSYFESFGYSFSEMFIDWVDFEICMNMNKNGYSVYCCQTSLYDHDIGGHESAEYALSEADAKDMSALRLTHLVKNSLSVISGSGGLLKYPFLIVYLYQLIRYRKPSNRKIIWKAILEYFFRRNQSEPKNG